MSERSGLRKQFEALKAEYEQKFRDIYEKIEKSERIQTELDADLAEKKKKYDEEYNQKIRDLREELEDQVDEVDRKYRALKDTEDLNNKAYNKQINSLIEGYKKIISNYSKKLNDGKLAHVHELTDLKV
ncbi:MAG: hypothetical protein IIZ11_01705, partial [Erysipelotrichaceae bacterium]|nr:hypothetical protein [Erysipelotrichaceae bacterium]